MIGLRLQLINVLVVDFSVKSIFNVSVSDHLGLFRRHAEVDRGTETPRCNGLNNSELAVLNSANSLQIIPVFLWSCSVNITLKSLY